MDRRDTHLLAVGLGALPLRAAVELAQAGGALGHPRAAGGVRAQPPAAVLLAHRLGRHRQRAATFRLALRSPHSSARSSAVGGGKLEPPFRRQAG